MGTCLRRYYCRSARALSGQNLWLRQQVSPPADRPRSADGQPCSGAYVDSRIKEVPVDLRSVDREAEHALQH